MKNLTLLVLVFAIAIPAMAWDSPQTPANANAIMAKVNAHTNAGIPVSAQTQNYAAGVAANAQAMIDAAVNQVANSCTVYTTDADGNVTGVNNAATQANINNNATVQAAVNNSAQVLNIIDTYINGSVGQISSYLNGSGGYGATYVNGYKNEIADFDAAFLKDLKDNGNQLPANFPIAGYLNDFVLAAQNNTPSATSSNVNLNSSGGSVSFEGTLEKDALDNRLQTIRNKSIRIDLNGGIFAWDAPGGINHRYLNNTVMHLLNSINSKLGGGQLHTYSKGLGNSSDGGSTGSATLSDQLVYLTQVWGKSLEQVLMDGLQNNNIGTAKTLILDGSGILVDTTVNPGDMASKTAGLDGLNDNGVDYYAQDGSFNARQWTSYSNGNYNVAKITTSDTTYELYDNVYTSPIVLDMNGDGRLEASNGEWLPHNYKESKVVEFDINGDGFMDLTEWVGPNDGLLIQYNDKADLDANQLFGEAGGFIDGYEKLTLLDANSDNQLAGEELKTLSVWQDANGNGKVEKGEISSVVELGITSLNLSHDRYVSSFVRNGETQTMWDWYPSVLKVKKLNKKSQ